MRDMNYKIPVLSVLLLALLPLQANAQHQWTLDECMDYAIAHNIEIQYRLNELNRRTVTSQASKDARLPRFMGNASATTSMLRHKNGGFRFDANASLLDMGLSGEIPLYTGNRLSSQIKADKYALLAAGEDVAQTERDIRVQVAAAYLQLLYNQGEVSIARQREELSQQLLTRARSLFDKGKCPKSDVAETTAMVSRDQALLAAAESDVVLARLDLRLLLNLPDSVDFDICQPSDSIETLPLLQSYSTYAQTSTTHPSVRSANFTIMQAKQGIKAARSGYLPTLSLIGRLGTSWVNLNIDASQKGQLPILSPWGSLGTIGYNISYESDSRCQNFLTGMVGLSLSVPIFNGFETKARIRTAKVSLDDAQLAYADAQQRVSRQISQSWHRASTAYQRYQAEVKAQQASALAYSYALKSYDAGKATIFDLSQSRQQWFTATENVLRIKYEYLIRKRILDIQASPL